VKRVEKKRYRKMIKRRALLGIIMCIILFCCGLKVVDVSTGDMLGDNREETLLKFSNVDGDIMQVDVIGEKILINKRKIKQSVMVLREKLGKFKKEVMSEE